jgi:hypothetical protein
MIERGGVLDREGFMAGEECEEEEEGGKNIALSQLH